MHRRVRGRQHAQHPGGCLLYTSRIPSLTDLKPGSEQFHIVTLPKTGTLDEFCCAAKAKSAAQKSFLDQDCETDALIYISTTPWFDLTSCTNERDFDKDDAIPRITWGKYVPENGRETLGMKLCIRDRSSSMPLPEKASVSLTSTP